ncbi:DNA gyrase inhibitor YacG [Aquisphaera giovannonii]|uniref:DNA gyrase inhibitor YacG n=1 Tax=Aquisphaera giovannonii TaxID=406548 RepID=A0A5B9W8Q9_9BACT|nr:DNA gyrase inhibitor YacG [Aquisphaera giovannonii]QEH36654.1 DNA gyrase inhibitor YacG [Aquisphaera giovannonii]
MIKGRCPTCSKTFEADSLDALPSFPFCSSRCRLIDLGRWIDGVHAIPGAPARGPSAGQAPPVEEDDPDDL